MVLIQTIKIGKNTALIEATKHNSPKVVRVLLKHGADVNTKDKDGETSLSLAEEKGYSQIVQILKQAGAKKGISKG
jgi:ankyrin repeat protein